MVYFFKFIYVLMLPVFIWSADINTTIVDGNVSVYHQLFQKISKENSLTDQIALDKTLLEQLINSENFSLFKIKKIVQPHNIEEYRQYFLYYLDDIKQIDKFQKKSLETEEKIEVLEEQIKNMDSNDSRLLGYELQDAFYHKKEKAYQSAIEEIKKEIQTLRFIISESVSKLNFDVNVSQEIRTIEQNLERDKENINKLQILLEQAELLNDPKKIKDITSQLEILKKNYEKEAKDLVAEDFIYFSSKLKKKREKAFEIETEIEKELLEYQLLEEDQMERYFLPLFSSMEKKYLGELKTLAGSSKQEIKEVLYQIWDFVNQPLFHINETSISILKLLIALLIFITGFIIGSVYKRKIQNLSLRRRSFTPSTRTILANLGYYVIVTIAFFMALNILGVKLTSIAMVAGALSVGIGFGLQNIVSNFVSGLILMFEKSVKIGDYIQIDDQTKGYVTDIRMRSTIINTNENIDIIIPNQSFIQNNVINWTMSDNIRRFSIGFGVAYGTDAHRVIDLVVKAVVESEYREDIVENEERKTRVIMTEMADSSVNFELLVWVQGDKMHKPKRTASEFLILIYDTLYANNIEIPFPQQDIHIRSVNTNIPLQIRKGEENA